MTDPDDNLPLFTHPDLPGCLVLARLGEQAHTWDYFPLREGGWEDRLTLHAAPHLLSPIHVAKVGRQLAGAVTGHATLDRAVAEARS